jgi:hypothetical protein
MSGVFQNIDPSPPHRPASVYPPPPFLVQGEDTLARGRVGGGSIVRKTPDTAPLYMWVLCGPEKQVYEYEITEGNVFILDGISLLKKAKLYLSSLESELGTDNGKSKR